MRGVLIMSAWVVLAAGCRATPPTGRFACAVSTDCPPFQRCDRGLCTNVAQADGGASDAGRTCETGCDDGVFCNGRELCGQRACLQGRAPCLPGLCDESARRCTGAVDSRVRFVHAISETGTIALADDDGLIEPSLSVGQVSEWSSALPLGRRVRILDTRDLSVIAAFDLPPLTAGDQTLVLSIQARTGSIGAIVVPEGSAQIRFVHAVSDFPNPLAFRAHGPSVWAEAGRPTAPIDLPSAFPARAVFEVDRAAGALATFSLDAAALPPGQGLTLIVFGFSKVDPSAVGGLRAILIGPNDVLTPTLYAPSDPAIWAVHPISGVTPYLCNRTRGTGLAIPPRTLVGPLFASASDPVAWSFDVCGSDFAPVSSRPGSPDRWLTVLPTFLRAESFTFLTSHRSLLRTEARLRWLHTASTFRDSPLHFGICAGFVCNRAPDWNDHVYGSGSPLEGFLVEAGVWTTVIYEGLPPGVGAAYLPGTRFVPGSHHLALAMDGGTGMSTPSLAVVETREDGMWALQWFP